MAPWQRSHWSVVSNDQSFISVVTAFGHFSDVWYCYLCVFIVADKHLYWSIWRRTSLFESQFSRWTEFIIFEPHVSTVTYIVFWSARNWGRDSSYLVVRKFFRTPLFSRAVSTGILEIFRSWPKFSYNGQTFQLLCPGFNIVLYEWVEKPVMPDSYKRTYGSNPLMGNTIYVNVGPGLRWGSQPSDDIKTSTGASLVAQWLRILLRIQGRPFNPWAKKIHYGSGHLLSWCAATPEPVP